MAPLLDAARARCFDLVVAAHLFLLTVLPVRGRESFAALDRFVSAVGRSGLDGPEIEAVLIRTLYVLSRCLPRGQTGAVERYLRPGYLFDRGVHHFASCVSEILHGSVVPNRLILDALRVVDRSLADSTLTLQLVARRLNVSPTRLGSAFRCEMQSTFRDYVRGARMERAAALLVETNASIKEVWVQNGYNHASNFDHDFRRHFGLSPSQYRRFAPAQRATKEESWWAENARPADVVAGRDGSSVMVVDDYDGTREVIARYLHLVNYRVVEVKSAAECRAAVCRETPDILLIDFHLPDVTGLQCLHDLRAAGVESPAVIFTADWQVQALETDIAALGGRLVSKVCCLEDVAQWVASALAQRPSSGTVVPE